MDPPGTVTFFEVILFNHLPRAGNIPDSIAKHDCVLFTILQISSCLEVTNDALSAPCFIQQAAQ